VTAKRQTLLGWHFLRADMTSAKGNEPPWKVGEKRTFSNHRKLEMCAHGYHACKRWSDADHVYHYGPLLCRVELSGGIQTEEDKSVGRTRKLLYVLTPRDQRRLVVSIGKAYDKAFGGRHGQEWAAAGAACDKARAACAYDTARAAYDTAWAAYVTAWAACDKARAAYAYDTARAAYDTAWAAYVTAWAASNKAWAAYVTARAACDTAWAAYVTAWGASNKAWAAYVTARAACDVSFIDSEFARRADALAEKRKAMTK